MSRILNKSGYASEEARKRVLESVAKLDYKPNTIARSLKKNKSQTIGLIVTDITNPFFAAIAKEAENVLSIYDYNLIICNTNEVAEKELRHLKTLFDRRVDGILLCSTGKNNKYIKKLVDSGIVVILIDRYYDELQLDVIKDDNFEGAWLMADYLIKKQHTRIALIRGDRNSSASIDREKGFRSALNDKSIPIVEEYFFTGGASGEYTEDVVYNIMRMDNRPTAIFAFNSLIAKKVIMSLNIKKVSIPDEMALACFGLEEFKTLYRPPITCIIQHPDRFGRMAAQLMVERIRNHSSMVRREIIFPPDLYIGESV